MPAAGGRPGPPRPAGGRGIPPGCPPRPAVPAPPAGWPGPAAPCRGGACARGAMRRGALRRSAFGRRALRRGGARRAHARRGGTERIVARPRPGPGCPGGRSAVRPTCLLAEARSAWAPPAAAACGAPRRPGDPLRRAIPAPGGRLPGRGCWEPAAAAPRAAAAPQRPGRRSRRRRTARLAAEPAAAVWAAVLRRAAQPGPLRRSLLSRGPLSSAPVVRPGGPAEQARPSAGRRCASGPSAPPTGAPGTRGVTGRAPAGAPGTLTA